MPDNKIKVDKVKEDLKRILEDIEDLNKDFEEAGEKREEISEDVDKIAEEVQDIKKEVGETGEDVEVIKEDIEEIKEDIGALRKTLSKGREIVSKVATSVLPESFAFKDIAQQIVGATIVAVPFAVSEEVWGLSKNLDHIHVITVISITIVFDILIFYYARYKTMEEKRFWLFPKRIISLLIVTYGASALILTAFGVIGEKIQDPIWAVKLVVMIGLFANIGASTADLIK